MTEEQIKEMLNGIINNGEKWEYRWCTADGWSNWKDYKLGYEIFDDYEYRKVETWYVYGEMGLEPFISKEDRNSGTKLFKGTKEDCEKWIEEHTNTWLEKEIAKSRYVKGGDIRIISTVVCRKILGEIAKKQSVPYATCEPIELTYDEIKQIIKDLGIEL